jgi:hypothetical protein
MFGVLGIEKLNIHLVHSPTLEIFLLKINEIKNYFNDRCDEIISLSEIGDPWVFLFGSAVVKIYLFKCRLL